LLQDFWKSVTIVVEFKKKKRKKTGPPFPQAFASAPVFEGPGASCPDTPQFADPDPCAMKKPWEARWMAGF
jgi:hypothetical protein